MFLFEFMECSLSGGLEGLGPVLACTGLCQLCMGSLDFSDGVTHGIDA